MGLTIITPPATTPLSRAEVKQHLNVTHTDFDSLIDIYNLAATDAAEQFMGRAIVDQTVEYVLDAFPTGDNLGIRLPWPKIIELISVSYDDAAGDEQVIDAADYYVDAVSEPNWLMPVSSSGWPTTIDAINAVRIRYRAGYLNTDSPPSANVPASIKAAILLTVGSLYAHRENIVVGQTAVLLPWNAENLLRPYRLYLAMA